ncbi:LysR family transcriptional regulator [Aerococcus kribbianus]|uniref:LysR family transcriptional regulator n=1 Tax=Aerococcus kribbianus TaxID=2999064 RepID=A0A9X3FU23_9LACT|nr:MULTISPECIES: LysR family transcriptional regulator [unclassified Aerococcus]MCZ0716861.1 LysR family transcriptional regulator [Aerococcus sp. YH-aer221]MCZ0725149.1 LysR family transcriptional regulator [Aerococcus sp. YH-aer222]
MRIDDLQYFLVVAQENSLTRAAEKLFISQPSLSNAMKKLEESLGVILFTRTSTGISLTSDGEEFLQYANQVLEQMALLQRRYSHKDQPKQIFSVASQHYPFVVDAFINMLKKNASDKYQATLKEMRTFEVIEDVANLKSEVGILYKSNYNKRVIENNIADNDLTFHSMVVTQPHVFIWYKHPLVNKEKITLEDLKPYPRLNFEQGRHNSFYYWEEVLGDFDTDKSIIVSDRGTIFNLIIGLNGYTISSGIINQDLNGAEIVARPIESEEQIEIGYITNNHHILNPIAEDFIVELEKIVIG